jgi:hypothetical protein
VSAGGGGGGNRRSQVVVVHHSRNSADKQWNETRVLALQAVARIVKVSLYYILHTTYYILILYMPNSIRIISLHTHHLTLLKGYLEDLRREEWFVQSWEALVRATEMAVVQVLK